ncbi:TetR/AcrR family transcriptional regulator [Caulobacter sp. 17J80-11]|uniref:TetR/AcrR family transcriptional regulator n=1 Tax=Caulobacter sp. 17J80-11 TaxID=2763502 RepID=UPI00165397AE|nr:TetR/AcrR family transcriptional regulator [Caulobacter sp. 17J80-11]MBC6981229.1 TetR/AcrR family transcriptional regulator [Caulobacter sp. 17J80-11]
MKNIDPTTRRPRGRPPGFDRELALDKAMRLFWDRGYEAASMDELTAAMGISPSSLYGAFGGKAQLYEQALDRYVAGPGAYVEPILAADLPTRDAFQRLLEAAAFELTRADQPRGCMVAAAETQCSPSAEGVRAAVAERRLQAIRAYEDRLRRGVAAGDLAGGVDVGALARFLMTVQQGLSVQARDGASREELLAVGRTAMRAWPS